MFVDTGLSIENPVVAPVENSLETITGTDQQSIAYFFSKPIMISSGNITTSSTGAIAAINISSEIAAQPLWANKLNGYAYYRGTAVCRLVINAQPFQAGRLILSYLPNTLARGSAFENMHNLNLTQITQQHNVELDFRETTAILKAPYRGPSLWAGGNGADWGKFTFSILSPLRTGTGSVDVGWAMYLSFEDFEVAAPIVGEMGDLPLKKKSLVVKERKNLASPSGRISGTLEKLKAPLDYFRFIPGSDFIITGAQNTLSGFAGILDVFGWSRPINPNVSSVMKFHNNYKGTNFNGSNDSDVLALDAMNQLMPLDGITKVDEMSFSYLKKIPAYIDSFTFTTGGSAGAVLYAKMLTMDDMTVPAIKTVTTKTYTYYTAPPFVWLSRYFAYWRGSIEITIKLVKTCYHTGRIAIVYEPYTGASAFPTLTNSAYALREIVDIREHSEIKLRIPWLRPNAYLWTRGSSSNFDLAMGRISILVVNPLEAPSTVANVIECLVYANAGDDFELAKAVAADTFVVAEMGDMECTRVMEIGNIGGYPINEPSISFVQSCIGEAFVSLKQLLVSSRPVRMITPWASLFSGYHSINLWPWGTGYPTPNGITNEVYTVPALGGDYISELSSGFSFYRGGIRLSAPQHTNTYGAVYAFVLRKFYTTLTNNLKALNPTALPSTLTGGPGGGAIANPNSRCFSVPQQVKTTFGGQYDVIVPYSNIYPYAMTCITTPNAPNVTNAEFGPIDSSVQLSITSTALTDVNFVMRSGADDFELFGFIGFLPYTSY